MQLLDIDERTEGTFFRCLHDEEPENPEVEVDTSDTQVMRAHGISDGIYLDGEPFRPDGPPFSVDELRTELLETHKRNGGAKPPGPERYELFGWDYESHSPLREAEVAHYWERRDVYWRALYSRAEYDVRMKSEPNIGRAAIASTLYREYGVEVERVSFWPVGEASYGYVVDLAGGKRYFIKLLNAGLSTHQPALRHLGRFVPLAAALAEAGLPVSRPVLTRSGGTHAMLGQYSLLAFEYVSGSTLGEKPWPVACYADLGATVGLLHSLTDDLTPPDPRSRCTRCSHQS